MSVSIIRWFYFIFLCKKITTNKKGKMNIFNFYELFIFFIRFAIFISFCKIFVSNGAHNTHTQYPFIITSSDKILFDSNVKNIHEHFGVSFFFISVLRLLSIFRQLKCVGHTFLSHFRSSLFSHMNNQAMVNIIASLSLSYLTKNVLTVKVQCKLLYLSYISQRNT